MNLLNNFVNYHLQTAIKEKEFSKSIISYSDADKIFVIGLGNIGGVITEQKKLEILKQVNITKRNVYFFTLFNNKEAFKEKSDMIAWGSYAWIATEPEHTIHFDNKPKLKLSHSQ